MLPGIFRPTTRRCRCASRRRGARHLEGILAGLPPAVFTADDGLGWVYQFWQTEKKQEVNASGRKIGGADLAPVTQLFTEDYMVRFLLENTLGAWWAARHPDSPLVQDVRVPALSAMTAPRRPAPSPVGPTRGAGDSDGPLRRFGPLPGGRVRHAVPHAHGGGGAVRGRGGRRCDARQSLHAGAGPPLHTDRRPSRWRWPPGGAAATVRCRLPTSPAPASR